MTNLEWLARNADDLYDCSFCEYAHVARHGKYCEIGEYDDCELRSAAELLKALNEEHEEKQNG